MADAPIKLLLVEDNSSDQLLVMDALETSLFARFEITTTERLDEAMRALEAKPFDVALLDLSLPDSRGLATFNRMKTAAPAATALIVLSGLSDEQTAIEAVRAGAQDYLVKNHSDAGALVRAIRYAVARGRLQDQLERSAEELRKKNAELEGELQMAREIQVALLPHHYPTFSQPGAAGSALRFAHYYRPAATLSGDFFTVLPVSENRAGVLLCDVMGHGVRAALMGALARGMIEELAPTAADPAAFLTGLNRGLSDILHHAGATAFASAFYFVADVAAAKVHFAHAGHPGSLILRRNAGRAERLLAPGPATPALGLLHDTQYTTGEASLSEQDAILLVTDGLYEAESGTAEKYGRDRLLKAVSNRLHQPCDALLRELLSDVQRFAGREEFTDDVCMVGMDVLSARPAEIPTV